LNVACQPFAALGTSVTVTEMPDCGFKTLKLNPEIDVVPGGSDEAIDTVLLPVDVPLQTRLSCADVHADGEPLYRLVPRACTSSAVTDSALIVVGACVTQLHCVGHDPVPGSDVFPDSWIDHVLDAGPIAVKLYLSVPPSA